MFTSTVAFKKDYRLRKEQHQVIYVIRITGVR